MLKELSLTAHYCMYMYMYAFIMHACLYTYIQVGFTLVDSDMCKPALKWAQGLINKTFSVLSQLLSFEFHLSNSSLSDSSSSSVLLKVFSQK